MITVPTETPASKPDEIPIDAIAGLALVQLPPVMAFVRGVDWPRQTWYSPVIGGGIGFTVSVLLTLQPVVRV